MNWLPCLLQAWKVKGAGYRVLRIGSVRGRNGHALM